MDADNSFPSRKWNEKRGKYISMLLSKLAELEHETDPAGGDDTAKGKDRNAFTALRFAGELVKAVAGWAIDHQVGLALSGLQFVPIQPRQTKTHPDYVKQRAEVDSHEHENKGGNFNQIKPDTMDNRIARQVIYNLMLANPGAFPSSVQQILLQALQACKFGEIPDFFKPDNETACRGLTLKECRLQLDALAFVEYRVRLGHKKYIAQENVGRAFGVSSETIRTWGKRLPDVLGDLEVERALSFAQNFASGMAVAVVRESLPADSEENCFEMKLAHFHKENIDKKYGDGALKAAGSAYKKLLWLQKNGGDDL